LRDACGFLHLRLISLTEEVISSEAAATDCTLSETSRDAEVAEFDNCWVVSAVLVNVLAAPL
jgi:hypothetical protein